MHILWMSDDPDTPSGFGNVTRWICDGLRRRGHRVSILGWQARERHEWCGCQVYPAGERLGSNELYPFLMRHRPDIVVTLADIWWLPYMNGALIRRCMETAGTPWVLYFPVDGDRGDTLPPSWIELLRNVDCRVAMSRYGQRIVAAAGLGCAYIPHGVNTSLFAPPEDRATAKRRLGLADRFVILSDSRNQPRKLLPRLLDVMTRLVPDCPDAYLHLHTDADDEFVGSATYSYDVRADIAALGLNGHVGLTPGMSVRKGGGVRLERLVGYYQAADVHLLASSGEGFGLPTLQAAAAGAIPMAVDYSANPELIGDHGKTIAVADWTYTEFGVRRAMLDVGDAAAKLRALAADADGRAILSGRARAFALGYDWAKLIEDWDGLLRSTKDRRDPVRGGVARVTTLGAIVPSAAGAHGANVRVTVAERSHGALEAMIRNDRRGQSSEVAIPTRPPPCRVGPLLVPREAGYVGMGVAPADHALFLAVRKLFPVIHGWTIGDSDEDHAIEALPFDLPTDGRYALARSILLLDLDGTMPPTILRDAACLGVPCVHGGGAIAQAFWPSLYAFDSGAALRLARRLLSDAASHRQVVEISRKQAIQGKACDEQAMELCIRQLHLRERERQLSRC